MTLENLPVWSFRPNWQNGVRETLSWLSTVLVSRSGVEQRIKMRNAPRRSWEVDFILTGDTRTRFDLATNKVGRGKWYLPVWPEGVSLASPLVAGHSSIPVVTENRGFLEGGALILSGRNAGVYEVLEIDSVDDGGIGTVTPATMDWPVGTKVLPARVGSITSLSGISRITASLMQVTVQFDQDGPEDFSGPYENSTTYRGNHVILTRPNSANPLTYQSNRLTVTLDNDTGLTREYDLADMSILGQASAYFLNGAEAKSDFRAMLYALAGQTQPVWMPTFMDDFVLAASAESTDTSIVVRQAGFTSFGGPVVNRQDILLALRDETAVMARITNSTTDGVTEVLHLDAPIGRDITPAEVKSISFMALSRLSADSIEIDHATDVDGLATATLNFVSCPDLRDASPLADVVLPSQDMLDGECGTPPPPPPPPLMWYLWEYLATGQPAYKYTDNPTFPDATWSVATTEKTDVLVVDFNDYNPIYLQILYIATKDSQHAPTAGSDTYKVLRNGDFSFTLEVKIDVASGSIRYGVSSIFTLDFGLFSDEIPVNKQTITIYTQYLRSTGQLNANVNGDPSGTNDSYSFMQNSIKYWIARVGGAMQVRKDNSSGMILFQDSTATEDDIHSINGVFVKAEHHKDIFVIPSTYPTKFTETLDWTDAL